jgi:hypothetical protein
MKLQGKRILLTKPEMKESVVQLTDEVKAKLEAEQMKKWTALEIFEIGDEVTKYKKGDRVYVTSDALQGAEAIPFDEVIKLMIYEGQVAILWEEADLK